MYSIDLLVVSFTFIFFEENNPFDIDYHKYLEVVMAHFIAIAEDDKTANLLQWLNY